MDPEASACVALPGLGCATSAASVPRHAKTLRCPLAFDGLSRLTSWSTFDVAYTTRTRPIVIDEPSFGACTFALAPQICRSERRTAEAIATGDGARAGDLLTLATPGKQPAPWIQIPGFPFSCTEVRQPWPWPRRSGPFPLPPTRTSPPRRCPLSGFSVHTLSFPTLFPTSAVSSRCGRGRGLGRLLHCPF